MGVGVTRTDAVGGGLCGVRLCVRGKEGMGDMGSGPRRWAVLGGCGMFAMHRVPVGSLVRRNLTHYSASSARLINNGRSGSGKHRWKAGDDFF